MSRTVARNEFFTITILLVSSSVHIANSRCFRCGNRKSLKLSRLRRRTLKAYKDIWFISGFDYSALNISFEIACFTSISFTYNGQLEEGWSTASDLNRSARECEADFFRFLQLLYHSYLPYIKNDCSHKYYYSHMRKHPPFDELFYKKKEVG